MESLNIIFVGKNKVEVVKEKIGLLKDEEVLCATDRSLISIGTELFCLRGVFDKNTNWIEMVKYPFYPGSGMSAHIIDVGKNVKKYRIGDRVVSAAGSHKQFFIAEPSTLNRIPDGITNEEAAWAPLALTTQLGIRAANLKLGESVGVIGVGVLGQLVTQYSSISGADEIIAIDKSIERLKSAKKHGATHSFSCDFEETLEQVKAITGDNMLDVVFDITGNPEVLSHSIRLLRKLGRVVLLGDTPTPNKQYLGPGVVSKGIKIIGVHGFIYPTEYTIFTPWTKNKMIELFYSFIIRKRMNVKDLITNYYSPIDATKVYSNLVSNRYKDIGIIFNWGLI